MRPCHLAVKLAHESNPYTIEHSRTGESDDRTGGHPFHCPRGRGGRSSQKARDISVSRSGLSHVRSRTLLFPTDRTPNHQYHGGGAIIRWGGGGGADARTLRSGPSRIAPSELGMWGSFPGTLPPEAQAPPTSSHRIACAVGKGQVRVAAQCLVGRRRQLDGEGSFAK